MWSYWERESFIGNPDVIIIGSGIVGLNAALALKSLASHLNVLVLERSTLPYGASTRNAGFACYGSPSELFDDLSKSNADDVFSLIEKRYKGLLRLRSIIGDKQMDYEPLGGYEIFSTDNEKVFDESISVLPLLNQWLKTISGKENVYRPLDEKIPSLGFRGISHMIFNSEEGQINTGKMMYALLEKVKQAGVRVLNGITVQSIDDDEKHVIVKTDRGTLSGKKVILATNGFAAQLQHDLNVQPARAQVLITQPIANLKFNGSFHYDHGYYYFRNVENRILLGGGRNLDFKNEFTAEFGLTDLIQSSLDYILQNIILPDQKVDIDMRWSGIMGLGLNKNPIIQQTSPNTFCAVRMGGMGVAIGSLAGEEVAQLAYHHL